MGVYKKWHMGFAPKYHFDYFTDRMTKMSIDKTVKCHISKLRDVYRGEADHTVEFCGEQVNLKDFQKEAAASMHNPGNQENQGVNGARATDKKEGIPYFSYDNQNASAGGAPQSDQKDNGFRMLDGQDENPIQMINTMGTNKPQQPAFSMQQQPPSLTQ